MSAPGTPTQDAQTQEAQTQADDAREARRLVRRGLKGALATLDRRTGGPYASLVTTATRPDGAPVVLISRLAEHTQNLLQDTRASILFDGTDGLGDPLQGGRVSVFGRMVKCGDAGLRARFLARHPSAELYADFADFAFWSLDIAGAHYVGGFGRIFSFEPDAMLTPVDDAASLIDAEPDIVAHMNADHADAVRLYATALLGARDGAWVFSGCDPEGCDLRLGDTALRLAFPQAVATPGDVRKALVALTDAARAAA